MKTRLFFTLLIIVTGWLLPLRAVEFRLISWEGQIQGLKYSNGKTQVDIAAGEGSLSSVFRFEGPGPLILYREVEQEGKTVREPMAALPVPEGFTQAIILLAYADAAKKTFTGLWINDAPEARPPQTITYRNLSSYPVAIKLGTTEYTVPPHGIRAQATDPRVQRMVFKAVAHTPAGWKSIVSTIQPVRPGLRTLVIMRDGRPDPATGIKEIVDLLMFDDYPPAPAGAPVASR